MARTDEERYKIQFIRLKREAEQRRLIEQEKIDLAKQERRIPIVVRQIRTRITPQVRRQRLFTKRRGFFWLGPYPVFKDGVRIIKRRRRL